MQRFTCDNSKYTQLYTCLRGVEGKCCCWFQVTGGSAEAKRYILEFCAQDKIMICGEEWVRLTVVGQSFMLHQIRKMVRCVVTLQLTTDSL